MCRALPSPNLGDVTSTDISIGLELTFADDRPSGTAHAGHGPERLFSGWLGLLAAIDALRTEAQDHHDTETQP